MPRAASLRDGMNGQFARAYLGIGEVLVELRGEFPDISVSKIRFLESEGLISPARSPSGYRRFGPADVDQLRFILTAQRDQYLPLRVIKERLLDRAAAQDGEDARDPRQGALDVAGAVAMLASYGVQARHLRTARTAADRDVSLIEQVVAPTLRQRSPQAREAAGRTGREISALLLRLHSVLVEAALSEAGLAARPGGEDGVPAPGPRAGGGDRVRDRQARPGVKDASA